MENALYTFEMLLQSTLKDKPDKQASVMEKAKLRVLKVGFASMYKVYTWAIQHDVILTIEKI